MKALLSLILIPALAMAQESPFNDSPPPNSLEAARQRFIAKYSQSESALNYAAREALIERTVSERVDNVPALQDKYGFGRALTRAMIEHDIQKREYDDFKMRR